MRFDASQSERDARSPAQALREAALKAVAVVAHLDDRTVLASHPQPQIQAYRSVSIEVTRARRACRSIRTRVAWRTAAHRSPTPGKDHGHGHRITGDPSKNKNRGIGWDAFHLAIDDHSRVAFARIKTDETTHSCAEFLREAIAVYRSIDARVES